MAAERLADPLVALAVAAYVFRVGVGLALVTVGSGIASTTFQFHDDATVTREVFENVPSFWKLAFYTVLPVVFLIGATLFAQRAKNWNRGGPDDRSTTRRNAARRVKEFRAGVYMQTLLRDPGFVSSLVNTSTPERHVLYEDPELGFCILAHNYNGAKNSPPHDHGPSWAIYGQAKGETKMTDYALVAPPADGRPGQARAVRTYKLTPGSAHLYNEGDLHSPLRRGPTQLIRIEGVNMDRIKRQKFISTP